MKPIRFSTEGERRSLSRKPRRVAMVLIAANADKPWSKSDFMTERETCPLLAVMPRLAIRLGQATRAFGRVIESRVNQRTKECARERMTPGLTQRPVNCALKTRLPEAQSVSVRYFGPRHRHITPVAVRPSSRSDRCAHLSNYRRVSSRRRKHSLVAVQEKDCVGKTILSVTWPAAF